METAKELRARLIAEGWPAGAAELAVSATARHRHEWRVEQTVQAAIDAVMTGGYVGGASRFRRAAALLEIEVAGIGGYKGIEGGGTDRILRSLGKGRWQATDGAAYKSAAQAAIFVLHEKAQWACDGEWRRGPLTLQIAEDLIRVPRAPAFVATEALRRISAIAAAHPDCQKSLVDGGDVAGTVEAWWAVGRAAYEAIPDGVPWEEQARARLARWYGEEER